MSGGNGGIGGRGLLASGTAGAGGVGIAGYQGATIITSGTISGGLAGGTGARAPAVLLEGGGNRLELRDGAKFNGDVVSRNSEGDTLALGGTTNSSFDAGQVGARGTIRGFTYFEKSGSSQWTLTGAGRQAWRIVGGSLVGSTPSMAGNLSFQPNAGAHPSAVFDQAGAGVYGGVISGAGALHIRGGGAITFSQAQSYTGGTTLEAGSLLLTGAGSFGAGALTVAGGANANLSGISAANLNVGDLSGAGGLQLGGKTLVVTQAADKSFGGTITGSGGQLVKTGAGTLTLTGANSYSGGTTISGGTLSLAADAALGQAGAGLVIDGGSLYSTASFSTARALTIGSGGATFRTAANTTLSLTGGDRSRGDLSGSGSLTKTGAGTLNIAEAALHAGGIGVNVNQGRLLLSPGATFIVKSAGIAANGALTVAGNASAGQPSSLLVKTVLSNDGSLSVGDGSLSALGQITNNGNFTVSAGGTVTAGAGTRSGHSNGASFVNNGTLTIQAGGTVNAGVFVQAGGVTTLNGGTIDPPQAIQVTGGRLVGTGLLDGNVTVSGGTVEVASGGLAVTGAYRQTGGELEFDIGLNGSGYSFGRLTATSLDLAGSLDFNVSGASSADMLRLQTDLMNRQLDLFGSILPEVSFSSIRLSSTVAGVSDVLLSASDVDQLDRALQLPGIAPVPEPGSYALLLGGLAVLAGLARRRQNVADRVN